MSKGRDDFDKGVIDALGKRAAYICSNPQCRTLTIGPSSDNETTFIYIGKGAHICAASSGGPRFDPNMSPEDRKSINNGIFLCSNCADMIDKNGGMDYPVDQLREWKTQHETWVCDNVNKRIQEDPRHQQVFNVTSNNQQGGITAGIVNVGAPPRHMDGKLQAQLTELLPDKSRKVTVNCVMNDPEAFNFATEIKDYLTKQGYSVKGVSQAAFSPPILGQQFVSDTLTLSVGTRQ